MANLLMGYQPEDSRQPNNFQLDKAFLLLPTVPDFQRCSILIDKLGVGFTPLVAVERMQDRGRPGIRPILDKNGTICEYALSTETLHFPITAVLDATEEATLHAKNLPTLPPELFMQSAGQTPSSSSAS